MHLDSHTRVVLLPRMTPRSSSLLRGRWSARALQEFVEAATALGISFVSLEHLLDATSPPLSVALVFDRFDAGLLRLGLPILEEYGAGYSVVVESARVGQRRPRGLRQRGPVPPWSELKRMVARGGDVVSGGHHGVSLLSLSTEVAYGELLRSRCEIERRLGRPPRAIRYPFGEVDAVMAEVAGKAGFEMGLVEQAESEVDALRWPVLRPRRLESPTRFARRIAEDSGSTPRRAAAGG